MKLHEHQKFMKAEIGDWLVIPKRVKLDHAWKKQANAAGTLKRHYGVTIDAGVYRITYINNMARRKSIGDLLIQIETGGYKYALLAEDMRRHAGYFKDKFVADVALASGDLPLPTQEEVGK